MEQQLLQLCERLKKEKELERDYLREELICLGYSDTNYRGKIIEELREHKYAIMDVLDELINTLNNRTKPNTT